MDRVKSAVHKNCLSTRSLLTMAAMSALERLVCFLILDVVVVVVVVAMAMEGVVVRAVVAAAVVRKLLMRKLARLVDDEKSMDR